MDIFFKQQFFIKFLKFCVVGFTSMIIDFSVTYFLKEKLKMQQFLANALGFCAAATVNFYLNRNWTFHSVNPDVGTEFSKFVLISLIGLSINSLIVWMLVKRFGVNFYFSKLVAIGVVIFWNFGANMFFTFAKC